MSNTVTFPALSLRQPWPWIIFHAGKDIENRFWSTTFRGRFLIHAAQGMSQAEYIAARDWAEVDLPTPGSLVKGGIVGYATIYDVLEPQDVRVGWHMPAQFGFRLTDIGETSFLALPGRQRFFKAVCPVDWATREGLIAAATPEP